MRTNAPPLLPLFRSRGQGRLLARVFLEPDRPAPIADLARELKLDAGGLTREADRLEQAGLVRSERIGRQRLLRPNVDSPYYPELYGLLLKAFGPAAVVGNALGQVDGVERVFLFGSWAARYLGVAGAEPADIDVMVVGAPPRSRIAKLARELTGRLGRPVNTTIVSPSRWEGETDGFIRQARRGPLVELDVGREGRG